MTLSGYEDDDIKVSVEAPENIAYLFVTKTCPNCRLAKEYLKDFRYVLIDAEENVELAQKYGVMQAPALVAVNGSSFKKYVNASRIRQFAESQKKMQTAECNL